MYSKTQKNLQTATCSLRFCGLKRRIDLQNWKTQTIDFEWEKGSKTQNNLQTAEGQKTQNSFLKRYIF